MTITATGLPAVSRPLVEQYARDLVRKGDGYRVLALRAAPQWDEGDVRGPAGERVLVRACVSPLAVREAMAEREPEDYLIVLTAQDAHQLGDSISCRLYEGQVLPVEPWTVVPAMFAARRLDPEVRRQGAWLATALTEHAPPQGYPAAPAGIVTLDHAMAALAGRVLDIPPDRLDGIALLERTADLAARDRWRAEPAPLREGIEQWAGQRFGAVGRLALRIAGSPGVVDAVTIGLAADVLWPRAGAVSPEALQARVRLEPAVGGTGLEPADARALADAARGVVLRMAREQDAGRAALLARAEALLDDLRHPAAARASAVLPAGYEARLEALAAALLDGERTRSVTATEDALAALLGHEAARAERADTTSQAEMAVRLLRWLVRVDSDAPSDLQTALLRQVREDGWVDRALADVAAGSTATSVATAYHEIATAVAARRTEHDRQLATLLSAATERDLLPEATVPLEDLVARVVKPLAARSRVLLVVVDGMSAAVATELAEGAQARGWVECVPAVERQRSAALAVLPSMTRFSRTSLLCGRLLAGSQLDEKREFPGLVGGGPLFHKDDLRALPGLLLPEPLTAAVASEHPVVGVVLNTVDDALSKADPDGTTWTVARVQHLGPLLDLAAAHDRVVVLTSDHGHVVERGSELRSTAGADTRFRPADSGPVRDDEVELRGRRVLAHDGAVIAPFVEGLRYGNKQAGYHGGASAAEVTVPVLVLAQDPARIADAGWVQAPPQAPRWWFEPSRQSSATQVPSSRTVRPVAARQEESLFDVAEAPAAAAPAAASPGRPAVVAALLGSDLYLERRRTARGLPADDVVAAVLTVLVEGGGRAVRETVAAAAGVPVVRLQSVLAVLRRLLNVEGYEVLGVDPDGVTLLLDVPLLREQFRLGSDA